VGGEGTESNRSKLFRRVKKTGTFNREIFKKETEVQPKIQVPQTSRERGERYNVSLGKHGGFEGEGEEGRRNIV